MNLKDDIKNNKDWPGTKCLQCKNIAHGEAYVDIITSSPFSTSFSSNLASDLSLELLKQLQNINIENEYYGFKVHCDSGIENFQIFKNFLGDESQSKKMANEFYDIMNNSVNEASSFAQNWIKLLYLNNLYQGPLNAEFLITENKDDSDYVYPPQNALWKLCLPKRNKCSCSSVVIRCGSHSINYQNQYSFAPNSLEFALDLVIDLARNNHAEENGQANECSTLNLASIAVMQNWRDIFLEGRLLYTDEIDINGLMEAPSFAEELNEPILKPSRDDSIVEKRQNGQPPDFLRTRSYAHSSMSIIIENNDDTMNLTQLEKRVVASWSNVIEQMVDKGKAIRLNKNYTQELEEISRRIIHTWLSNCSCN